jgi:hypothetical protein
MTASGATWRRTGLGLVLASLAAAMPSYAIELAPAQRPHFHHSREWYAERGRVAAARPGGPKGVANLQYHGGPVMLTSSVYNIYWVPPPHVISSTYQQLIDRWFSDVGGSSMYGINSQYYEDSPPSYVQNVATLGGSWLDTGNPYPHAGTGSDPLTDADIQAEVVRAIAANGWPNGGTNAMFMVFTAKGVESCADPTDCTIGTAHPVYCAYHWYFFSGNSDVIIYANMPYGGTWLSGYRYSCGYANPSPNNDEDADVEISTASHEEFEAVTDFVGNAWYDSSGEEIGDKCAYTYGAVAADGSNVVINGNPYHVQQEWSNAISGCTLSSGVLPTPTPTPTQTLAVTPTRTNTSIPTPTATSGSGASPTPTRTLTPTPKHGRGHH